jgi:DNA-binding LacI/PurR family transcriptional regulator
MPVKLKDIARESGFSIATVSRVLNSSDYPVSASARGKILETLPIDQWRFQSTVPGLVS